MSNLQNHQLPEGIATNTECIAEIKRHQEHLKRAQMMNNKLVEASLQAKSQGEQPPIAASINGTDQFPQPSDSAAPDMRISVKSWTLKHYTQLGKWVDERMMGEEIMQRCGIKRRKDLQALVQVASQQRKVYLEIRWNMESLPGEGQRALPPLKVGDDGSFRISKTRLARLGIKFPEGAKLRVQKSQDGCLIVLM